MFIGRPAILRSGQTVKRRMGHMVALSYDAMMIDGGTPWLSTIVCTIRTQSTRCASPPRCRSLEPALLSGARGGTRAFPEADVMQSIGVAAWFKAGSHMELGEAGLTLPG